MAQRCESPGRKGGITPPPAVQQIRPSAGKFAQPGAPFMLVYNLNVLSIFLFFFAQLPSRLPLLRVRRNAAQAKWNAEASLENHRPLQTSAQCRHRRFEAAPKKFARKVQLFSIFCMRSLDARRREHVLVHNVRPRHVDTSSVEDALSRC